jgi:dihydrofolate synthase/folylpolyglutamate synthase
MHGSYGGVAMSAPSYQAANIATALVAAEAALAKGLRADAARHAFAELEIAGRFQLAADRPVPIVLDGAHNPQAAGVLAEAIREAFPEGERRPVAVLGVLQDKDARGIVEALAPAVSGFVVTAPISNRALAPESLAAIVRDATGEEPRVVATVAGALDAALGSEPRAIVVTGSLVTVGEALSILDEPAAVDDGGRT